MRRDVADRRPAARLAQRDAVHARGRRLAHVRVVERRLGHVERDVAVAAGRRQLELVLVALRRLLDHLARHRDVTGDHPLATQHLRLAATGSVALADLDLVNVGRAVVGLRVPVGVADQLDAAVGTQPTALPSLSFRIM